jgi:hypothetical protein
MIAIRLSLCALVLMAVLLPAPVSAQGREGGAPQSARAAAPIDLTGYWVAVVNEDWRYRMVTPPKGEYRGVPLTKEALQVLNAWDPAADEAAGEQCKSYGAGAVMRLPARLHITWQDDNTLRVDVDAGTQTRLFRFGQGPAAGPGGAVVAGASSTSGGPKDLSPGDGGKPTWQGDSTAQWERAGGRGGPPAGGSLTVLTRNMRAGYLRKNGVPYSADATVSEYFDLSASPGSPLLVVTTVVDDARYLLQPFIVSSHFKKEADGSKWDPTPCSARW